jgi:hypothetical protein
MENLSLLKNGFYKKSRRGNLLKLVRERYLRDDVACGYLFGSSLTEVLLLTKYFL